MTPSTIANILLFIVPVILTLYITFRDRLRSPGPLAVSVAVAAFLVIDVAASLIYFHVSPSRLSITLLSTVAMISGVVIFYTVVGYRFSQCLFIISIIKCCSDNVLLISSLLYFIIKGSLPETLLRFPVWCYLIATAVSYPLIGIFYKRLLRPALDYTETLPFWSFMWGIPMCNSFLYSLTISPSFTPASSHPGGEFYLIPLLWVILSFSTYILLLKTITVTSRNALLQEKLYISEVQIAVHQKELEGFQARLESTNRMRHDMRHHFLALRAFADQKDYDGITAYLTEYMEQLDIEIPVHYSDNITLNYLLSYYEDLSKENNIDFLLSHKLPYPLPISDTDLCIILGNLMENAVEACIRMESGERFIKVRLSLTSRSVMVIIIENSYAGQIRRLGDTFLSSKEKERKGIGISSVLNIAEKYKGIPKFEYNGSTFTASLLLTGSPRKES